MGKTYLVAGASGGIGAEIVRQLLPRNDVDHIFTLSREATETGDSKRTAVAIDYFDPASIEAAVTAIAKQADAIEVFICATGMLHDAGTQPEKRIDQLDIEALDRVLRANATGPMLLLAACMPLLKRATQPKAAVLSAQVGSIEDNELGGWYGYRMAKAALNMGIKNAAIEASRWRNNPSIIALHPGTTHTNLSEPFVARRKQRVRTAEETGSNIISLVDRLRADQNGQFLTSDGGHLPW